MGGATGASGTAHPFTGYNKKEIKTALVGNWVEERCLEDATGTFRYKEWVGEQQVDTVYAKTVGKPEGMPSHERVLEHSDRLESGQWETSNQVIFPNPASRTNELRTFADTNKVGPRTAALLAQMHAQSLVKPPEPEPEKHFETTKQASYGAYDLNGHEIGAKVMQTLDLVPIPQSAKDPTFQAECGLIAKATVDKALLPTVDPAKFAEDYVSATPITIYSQKVQTGVYPTTETYGSEVRGPNPFAKTSEFSKPLSDHTKDPAYLC